MIQFKERTLTYMGHCVAVVSTNMADEVSLQNAKPDGSMSNINATTAQQLIVASEGGIECANMHSFLLRGKPFEALGSFEQTTCLDFAR